MAKPRIFVSSTYYDLKHIRNSLEAFIKDFGYEPILFESGDIPFVHTVPLDISCYEEIKNAHIFVLIIGGRYGSSSSEDENQEAELEFYNSITKKEYENAIEKNIPIYIFIEKNVLAEYYTYKKNRENKKIKYAHVDNTNIFKLIDVIYSQKKNNLVKDFENFDDISSWLKDQWAGIFADFLSKTSEQTELANLSSQISDLRNISTILREYSEVMMRKINPDNVEKIISSKHKVLNERRLQGFIQDKMIEYLLENAPDKIGEEELFNAFSKSKDVVDFLAKSNFEQEFIENLISKNEELALEHYNELKEKFPKI